MTTVSKEIVQTGARLIQSEVASSLKKKMSLQSAISLSAKVLGLKNAHHASGSQSSTEQGTWHVVGQYPKTGSYFVDKVESEEGCDALLHSSMMRDQVDSKDGAPIFLMAIHTQTGECFMPSEESQPEQGVKQKTDISTALKEHFLSICLPEYDEIISAERLVEAMVAQEEKLGRKAGAGALSELAVEFVHNELGGRTIDCGRGEFKCIQDIVDIDLLSNRIRESDGSCKLSKHALAQLILGYVRNSICATISAIKIKGDQK